MSIRYSSVTSIAFVVLLGCCDLARREVSSAEPADLSPRVIARLGKTSAAHTQLIHALAFSADGQTLASAGTDGMVRLWSPATGREVRTLSGHEEKVWSVAFSPDGKVLASASDDRTVRIWVVATGTELLRFEGHQDWVLSVAFSPDGKVLASGGDRGTVLLWDPATGRKLMELSDDDNSCDRIAFSADGKTLAAGGKCLWDLTTGRVQSKLNGTRVGSPVALAPDGNTLVTGGCHWAIWDVATGRELIVWKDIGPGGGSAPVAFSPDGKTLALWGRDTNEQISLRDSTTGKELVTITPPPGSSAEDREWRFTSLAFAPDGKTLATGSERNTILLWNVASITGRSTRR